jgi:hypothetical protein
MGNKTMIIITIAGFLIWQFIRQQESEKEAEILAMLAGGTIAADRAPGVAGAASAFDECRRQKEVLQSERDATAWIKFRQRRRLGEKIRELPC